MAGTTNRFMNPETLAPPTGYTHVVESSGSRTVYISGQIALDAQGNLVGPGDMAAQARQVFANLEAALNAVGASVDDLVKLTYYLVDISRMAEVRAARDAHIDPTRLPASTAVEVRRLVREDLLLEVDAIAVLD